jgi:prolyl oligopeptidase PreP (S9A serine peptidase family)
MGAMLTQHPGLSRAVVAMVPVMDMLRVELDRNGTFNVGEYGTVNVPALRGFDVIAWMEGRKKDHGLQASDASC